MAITITRRGWIGRGVAAGLLLAAAISGGCIAWDDAKFEQTTTLSAPHRAGSGLRVKAHNGSVTVRKSPGSEVSITAHLKMTTEERLGQVTLVANRDSAGVLDIYAEPPEGHWKGSEGCAFEITLPEAVGVEIHSDNGRIEIGGLAGAANLETSNGRIVVQGHDGDLKAETSNGKVEAEGVTGPADVRTSNGSVTLRLADANPGPVTIRTSNGAVELMVGSGFRGDLSVDTSNGSIRVPESAEGVRVRGMDRHSARLTFGDGGKGSSIQTSNGSVTVERR